MAETLRLSAELQKRGPAGAFVLTDEQAEALGGGKRAFPVRLTVAEAVVPLRLARMGGENLIGLSRAAREAAGLVIGETYAIEIALDDAERTVEVPGDLADALSAEPAARTSFDALAPSHRKEFVRWVTEAKREQTRLDRIAKTVEMVLAGRTR